MSKSIPLKAPKGYEPVNNDLLVDDLDVSYDLEELKMKTSLSKEDFEFTSRWDSSMFNIMPQSPADHAFELSEYFNEHIQQRTKWMVLPAFTIITVATIVVAVCFLIGKLDIWISFGIILGLNWLGAGMGMFGVYRWGSVEGVLEWFRSKNAEYSHEIKILSQSKRKIKSETKNIHFEVGQLNNQGEELERNLESFDVLRKDLKNICGQNEDLLSLLDNINKQYDDWQNLMYENQKAHLTSIYYEAALRDGEHGLTKKEYKVFLARLSKHTRNQFELQGGFEYMDSDQNGIVDLNEFHEMVDTVLDIINSEQKKLMHK